MKEVKKLKVFVIKIDEDGEIERSGIAYEFDKSPSQLDITITLPTLFAVLERHELFRLANLVRYYGPGNAESCCQDPLSQLATCKDIGEEEPEIK